MNGPGDDEELFENRDGESVPKDNLAECELSYYESGALGGIHEYCRRWERGQAFDDDLDPEAFDKDPED